MSSALSRFFPRWNSIGTVTLVVAFLTRPTSGSGTWGYLTGPTTVAIPFPNGSDSGVPVSQLADTILRHFMNGYDPRYWSPKIGSVESIVRNAILSGLENRDNNNNEYMYLFFDGEFGPVFAA